VTIARKILICTAVSGAVWFASEWWETGLAQPLGHATISPNGCYRVETFKPFWILPDIFHRWSHPDDHGPTTWFPWWEYPGFYRLYDQRTGQLLGQSKIYDLQHDSGQLGWGSRADPEVTAGLIYIGPNTPDCIGDRRQSTNSSR